MNKIVVVGTGNVGMAYAYGIITQGLNVDEIILIDIDNKKALGQAMDLSHCGLYTESKTIVKAGSYIDCKDAKIVLIAAGANQKSNESRLELSSRNNEIIRSITTKVVASGFNGIFLVATNPVDVMTYMVRKYSGFDASKVIGSGTSIDTARLSFLLSGKLNVNLKDINIHVIGEHGDSALAVFSGARVGALDLEDIILKSDLKQIESKVKRLPYKIIDLKGETSYAVATCLIKVTKSIINDDNSVICVSAPYNGVYMGMPSVINSTGIKGVMKVKLTGEEATKLDESREILKETIKKLEE